MAGQHTILAVDDEPINLAVINELLEDHYNILTAENGQACLELVNETPPDLILMDVNMPLLDGIETCKQLKEDFNTASIPIIFVSALSSHKEKMVGYKAGAEDYVCKPFDGDELFAKVALTLSASAAIAEYEKNSSETMNMAMTALSTAGNVGTALQFSNASLLTSTADELAELLLEHYSIYGLIVTLRYAQENSIKFYSHSLPVSEVEKKLMNQANEQGRFIDFGKRTLVNYERISVLIKKAKSIEIENALNTIILSSKEILTEIDQEYKSNGRKNESILALLHQKMGDAFLFLEMRAEDEDSLISILVDAESQSKTLYKNGLNIEDKIARLMGDIDAVL